MSSQSKANIRLVKCPKCHNVLPELSDVPVYQCGGCDAVLQVKKRKNGINDTGLHTHKTDMSQQNETQNDDVDLLSEFGHLENEKLSPISVFLSESQENCPQNQESSPVDEGVSPSNELTCHEIDDLSSETGTSNEFDKDAISHYIFGNFKKKMDPEDSSVTPQKLSRKSTFFEQLELSQLREVTEVEPITSKENNKCIVDNELSCQEQTELKKSRNCTSPQLREPSRFDSVGSEKKVEKVVFTNVDSTNRDNHGNVSKGYVYRKDQFFEPDGHGRAVRNKMRVHRDEKLSRAHFHSRVFSTVGYEYGSCSNPVPNHDKSSKFSPKPEDQEYKKLNLKRLILELQDQLNRSHTPKGYHKAELKDVRDQNIYYQRPQMGHSCLQFPTRECHCSSPTSPHFYSKPSQCTAHLNSNNHNTHCPCSEFCVKTHEIVKNNKERNHAMKRHVLPEKGGAPLVICDNCSKLLQFPGDFLLFRKRYHRLKCGSCSYVLKFSLRDGYKLDRYVYEYDKSGDLAPAPPPSEVGDSREMSKGNNMHHVDPVFFR